MIKILILCTGNSCRSQMAEGFLKHFDNSLSVFSAGTYPAQKVSSRAIKVMSDIGIDISNNKTKSVDEFLNDNFDYVLTVCDNAKETCPVFTGKVKNRLHIGFEDPAAAVGSEEEIILKYIEIRDEIRKTFLEFYIHEILKFNGKIKMQLQHFHGCPNSPKMLELVNNSIIHKKNYIEFENLLINNDDDAKKYMFRGSPTLLIEGIDIENLPEPLTPAITCRLYSNGLPDLQTILDKILKAIKKKTLVQ